MARLNLAPTKSNLLMVRGQLRVAREGFELLEQKREILVMELMRTVEEVKLLERGMEKRVASAYPALRRLLMGLGRDRAAQAARGIQGGHSVREKRLQAAGLSIKALDFALARPGLGYSFGNSIAASDQTMVEFTELLGLAARLAVVRAMVWRLSVEVRKTQRRVNALEKMVIPETAETVHYMEGVLEERDREGLFVMKLIKAGRGGGQAG